LSSEQAKDLTQDYFRHLISSNLPAQADPERGKFRSFLLLTLKHFLADASRRARRARCIPPGFLLPLEASDLQPVLDETSYARGTPEAAFDRTWARTLVNETRRKLEAECLASGKQAFFQAARDFLPGGQSQRPYVELAQCLNVDLNVAKVRVHRLRQRFAEILREEIAQTVSQPGEVDEEVRYLIDVLSQTESGAPCPET